MQKRKSFFPVFLIFFILAILLFILSRAGFLNGLTGFFEIATVPLQRAIFGTLHTADKEGDIAKLRETNSKLAAQIVKQKELELENKALQDQFKIANPIPKTLLPAKVIGIRDEKIVIDKGDRDGVANGGIVVYEDNLIGKIVKTSEHISIVQIITSDTSLTAQTINSSAQGVVVGGAD